MLRVASAVSVRHVWCTLVARLVAIGDNEVLKQGGGGIRQANFLKSMKLLAVFLFLKLYITSFFVHNVRSS